MLILTPENISYNLDTIPDEIEDIRYCCLDCTDEDNMDYFFLPLIFLESFYSPAIQLKIGKYKLNMPLDWSIMVCDSEYSDLEVMPLTSLNDRGFRTIVFNPLISSIPETIEVEIENVYIDVKWYFPKLKHGNLLVVPLEEGHNPRCALFVKEGNKIPDPIEIRNILI